MVRVHQLITYFDKLLDFLVNPIFVSSPTSCINEKYLQHGILVKNMLHYIRKCMHSKIENYWENCNLAASFTLTYGNFNEYTNYYHVLPVGEVKSIITTLDQKLINLLVNQIKHIETSEYIVWENTVDDEITTISLQQGIAMECHYFTEFVKQNKCFMTNEELFPYLKRLVDPKKSEESILTLQELCRKITDGRLHDMRELIKRYKEWDLSILDFINEKIELLKIYDVSVILEYVHYIFPYLHTNAKKYRVCVSVLKILIQLTVNDLHYVVQNYVEQHFDDNPLEYLYNEKCFIEFIERSSFIEPCEMTELVRTQELCTLLTYILLNPKEVLSKIVMYEIDVKFSHDFMFEENMSLVRSYYTLKSNECNVLMYILKDMIFVQRIILCSRFIDFMDNVLSYQVIQCYK
ncbi:PREDICTED: LOW QUALITY PROTEIN: uncharacterized protein LOC108746403 [Trachymyrmex septentrionalis]|uniref:LOW QUALITY PROTEIN: uncharacterized protein LOC108746403 n=1 Tax=Trachymyrmex septentrionalis TaxID=34720 RepID=UPI00084F7405|nr:PREDICTED: LOW QUALITY PROTEIN: uncharacterized protein LOC108746403 [Trachymyrmex septentrionalis]